MTDGELREALKRIENDVKEVKEALKRDFNALYGNGHAGLLSRMASMETWQKGHGDAWKWIISTIIAAAAVAVAALKKG